MIPVSHTPKLICSLCRDGSNSVLHQFSTTCPLMLSLDMDIAVALRLFGLVLGLVPHIPSLYCSKAQKSSEHLQVVNTRLH